MHFCISENKRPQATENDFKLKVPNIKIVKRKFIYPNIHKTVFYILIFNIPIIKTKKSKSLNDFDNF